MDKQQRVDEWKCGKSEGATNSAVTDGSWPGGAVSTCLLTAKKCGLPMDGACCGGSGSMELWDKYKRRINYFMDRMRVCLFQVESHRHPHIALHFFWLQVSECLPGINLHFKWCTEMHPRNVQHCNSLTSEANALLMDTRQSIRN